MTLTGPVSMYWGTLTLPGFFAEEIHLRCPQGLFIYVIWHVSSRSLPNMSPS